MKITPLKSREILTEYWQKEYDVVPSPYDRDWLIGSYFDLHGLGGGFDAEITPRLRTSFNVNSLWFADTASLDAADVS